MIEVVGSMRAFSLSSISLIHFTLFISDNYVLFLKNTYSYQTLNYVFSVLKNVIKTCYQTHFFFFIMSTQKMCFQYTFLNYMCETFFTTGTKLKKLYSKKKLKKKKLFSFLQIVKTQPRERKKGREGRSSPSRR